MLDPKRGNKFIFVGGCPRSGTTLIQNMLDSHPDILGGPEFRHIGDIIKLRRKLHESISREYIDLFCSYDDVDRYIISLIEKLLLPLADKHRSKFLSEKTPWNIFFFHDLIEIFPQAKFIHMIRDPRAIISSMKEVRKRAKDKDFYVKPFSDYTSRNIEYLKRYFNAGFSAVRNAPDKTFTIVYEQLVEDPIIQTKRICEFLGLEWNRQMIYPGNRKHLGDDAMTIKMDEVWYNTKNYNQNPGIKSIDKWKNQLKLFQQISITTAFKDNEGLKQFGYDFSLDNLSQKKTFFSLKYINLISFCQKLFKYFLLSVRRIRGLLNV